MLTDGGVHPSRICVQGADAQGPTSQHPVENINPVTPHSGEGKNHQTLTFANPRQAPLKPTRFGSNFDPTLEQAALIRSSAKNKIAYACCSLTRREL